MKRNGFTLVELLVGMVIAMLCAIMMMMLFKQLSQIGGGASRDAQYDAQIETGILIIQKYLQNAGYASGNAADVQLNNNFGSFTSAGVSIPLPALLWRQGTGALSATTGLATAWECYGVTETITPNPTATNFTHRLQLLTLRPCNGAGATTGVANLTAMTGWTQTPIVRIDTPSAQPIFGYALSTGSCAPYGTADVQGAAKVTLTAKRLNVTSGLGQSLNRAVCLNNIGVTP